MTYPTQTPLTQSSMDRVTIAAGAAFLANLGNAMFIQSMTLMIATLAPLAIASTLAAYQISQTVIVD